MALPLNANDLREIANLAEGLTEIEGRNTEITLGGMIEVYDSNGDVLGHLIDQSGSDWQFEAKS